MIVRGRTANPRCRNGCAAVLPRLITGPVIGREHESLPQFIALAVPLSQP
jgi:hypothetical protein